MTEIAIEQKQTAGLISGINAARPLAAKNATLQADGDTLAVSLSNGSDCTLSLVVACQADEIFKATCGVKPLLTALKALGEAPIRIDCIANDAGASALRWRAGERVVLTPIIHSVDAEFQHLATPTQDFCRVGPLRGALGHIRHAMPEYDTNKLFLNGAYLTGYRVIASDGYRLAYASLEAVVPGAVNPVLLSRGCALTLERLAALGALSATEIIKVRFSEGVLTLQSTAWTLTGRAVDNPEYYKHMERGLAWCCTDLAKDVLVTVEQQKLFKTVQRCPDKILTLSYQDARLTIESDSSRDVISVGACPNAAKVRFNRKYLRDALNAQPKGAVSMSLNDRRITLSSPATTNVVMCVRS